MEPVLLNCLAPIAFLLVLAAAVVVSIRRWPSVWPEPLLETGLQAENWSLSQVERARMWLWPQPDEPLDSLQRRLRQTRASVSRWSSAPRNRLSLNVAAGAIGAILIGLIGLTRAPVSLWNQASFPIIAAAVAIFLLDLLNRRRADLQEKERVVRSMGSRSNHIALDAARTVVERDWHRDGSLMDASFDHANLRSLAMARARLRGISFMYAELRSADLMFADLSGARLGSADLRGANLSFSSLDGAALGLADLGNASLGRCSLRGAHLEGANLCGAFLEQSDLTGAHLEQAIYNSKTHWPVGFTPPDGAINWDRLSDTERDWFRQWRWYVE